MSAKMLLLLLLVVVAQSKLFSIMPEVSDTLLSEAGTKLPIHARFELEDDNVSIVYDGICKDCTFKFGGSDLQCEAKRCSTKPRVSEIDDFMVSVLKESQDSKLIQGMSVSSQKVLHFKTKWIKVFRSL